MTTPRISDFWLDPSRTIDRQPFDDCLYCYAVERGYGGLVVHRFRQTADRAAWVGLGNGKRHNLFYRHKLVQEAKEADDWPDKEG